MNPATSWSWNRTVVGREQRVHPAFLADGRRRIVLHRPGRAEVARAVVGHRDVVRQPGERTQRVELLASQASVASSPSRSVRPTLPASSDPPVRTAAGVASPIAARSWTSQARCSGVWPGVARARSRTPPTFDLVAVVGAPVIEGVASPGWGDHARPFRGDQLQRAGQVVVMDVRLDDRSEAASPAVPGPPGPARRCAAGRRPGPPCQTRGGRSNCPGPASAGSHFRGPSGAHHRARVQASARRSAILAPDRGQVSVAGAAGGDARSDDRGSGTLLAMMEQFHLTDLSLTGAPKREDRLRRPGSWSRSTSIRGRRSRGRAGSPGPLHGCPRPADVACGSGPP